MVIYETCFQVFMLKLWSIPSFVSRLKFARGNLLCTYSYNVRAKYLSGIFASELPNTAPLLLPRNFIDVHASMPPNGRRTCKDLTGMLKTCSCRVSWWIWWGGDIVLQCPLQWNRFSVNSHSNLGAKIEIKWKETEASSGSRLVS